LFVARSGKFLPSLGRIKRAYAKNKGDKESEKDSKKEKKTTRLMHNLSQLKQENVSQLQMIAVKMVIARRNFIRRISAFELCAVSGAETSFSLRGFK